MSSILTLIAGPIPAIFIALRHDDAWTAAAFALIALMSITLLIVGLARKLWLLATASICVWSLTGLGVAVVASI